MLSSLIQENYLAHDLMIELDADFEIDLDLEPTAVVKGNQVD